jgi:hypothetical protein
VSANPAVTIEHFEAEAYRADVAEGSLESSRGSAPNTLIVATLYAAAVVPAMMGWLYFLARCSWKLITWMAS